MPNKIAIVQPYFLPYLGYFQLINAVDTFVLLDDVNFIKKGWINRNKIISNGREFTFTIPIKKASQNKKINELDTVNDLSLVKKQFIYSYKNSSYFDIHSKWLFSLLDNAPSNLLEFCHISLSFIKEYLNINTEFKLSSDIANPKLLKGQDRIINICLDLEANQYINPIGGMDIYNKSLFNENGIELFFLKKNPVSYCQNTKVFIDNLSIIDCLMNENSKTINNLLNHYELVD